jgi:membrane-associated phospholipid phosphatase
MKKVRLLMLVTFMAICSITNALASDFVNMEPMKLQTPEMKPEMVTVPNRTYRPELEQVRDDHAPWSKDNWTWMHTNEGVKPYKVMDDLTFVGIPLFAAGWAVKGDKSMFRVNLKGGKKNTQLLTDFKTGIDDYTQFFGPALTVGLKIGGLEGRSDWGRLLASAGMSYAIMAGFVNGIKYTAKEMRPDGSTANSWPSGHTATSFVGATILHKEYGLTRSPWFSIAGYGVATATGVMRVLNNRHWISDVMSGAGIGIMSAELGYALSDILFKGKGLLRNDLMTNPEKPSFFAISMGLGLGSKDIGFTLDDLVDPERYLAADLGYDEYDDYDYEYDEDDDFSPNVHFRHATVVDAEGAYFFNKYIGIGGRARVRAMSAKTFGRYTELAAEDQADGWFDVVGDLFYDADNLDIYSKFIESALVGGSPIKDLGGVVMSDHLTEFSASAGVYFNLPLGKRFSLGSKLLIGRSFTQELDIDGFATGQVKDLNYHLVVDNGVLVKEESDFSYPFDA